MKIPESNSARSVRGLAMPFRNYTWDHGQPLISMLSGIRMKMFMNLFGTWKTPYFVPWRMYRGSPCLCPYRCQTVLPNILILLISWEVTYVLSVIVFGGEKLFTCVCRPLQGFNLYSSRIGVHRCFRYVVMQVTEH